MRLAQINVPDHALNFDQSPQRERVWGVGCRVWGVGCGVQRVRPEDRFQASAFKGKRLNLDVF